MYELSNGSVSQSEVTEDTLSVPQEQAVASPGGTQTAELATIFDRLKEVVDAETAALASHERSDISQFARKKSQILLEVTRLTKLMHSPIDDEQLHLRMESIKASLELNRIALEVHLRAANQLTEIISNAVRTAESDGTYSAPAGRDYFI